MANIIKCPVCNEKNSSDQEFCQFCQSPLQTASSSSLGINEGFKPGQAPTSKVTADLEPILPDWLRQARNSARTSAADDSAARAAHKPSHEFSQPSPPPDLLAGLQAQSDSDDDDDTPDWLANITGAAPAPKKTQPDSSSSDIHWVELGSKKDFAPQESAVEDETPSWLANLASSSASSPEKDELTDWMREASGLKPQPAQPPAKAEPAPSSTPDWLNDGAQNNAPSFNATPAASDTPDWLRQMAVDNDTQNSAPATSDTPDWLSQMKADDGEQNSAPSFNATPSASDTPDWLSQMKADDGAQNNAPSFNATPSASDTPDWLRQMAVDNDTQNSTPAASDTPDWLSQMKADDGAQNNTPSFNATPAASDTPDWLSQMKADDGAQNNAPSFNATPAASDTPDWLSQMKADDGAQNSVPSFNATPSASDTPDWLSSPGTQDQTQSADPVGFSETGFGTSDAAEENTLDWLKGLDSDSTFPSALPSDDDWLKNLQPDKKEQSPDADMPSWLSDTAAQTPATPVQDEIELGDVPSWLKAAAPRSSIYGETSEEKTSEPVSDSAASTDWLNAFKSIDTPQPAPAFAMDKPVDATPPSFTPASTPASQKDENVDGLFTDMPDWLTGSLDAPAPTSLTPTPMTNSDALAAGELPAWVQAMRPVDTGVSQFSSTLISSDQKLESSGALAGLQGVLPAAPNYAPTSKPKTYSIKLQASDEQYSQAALLEQILAAETEPVPIASYSALRTSRVLRWALAFLLITVITIALVMPTPIFLMPNKTFDIDDALKTIAAIPEDKPVLAVFDYEPARVGEMEAAAAPLFDQMLLLRHPRLTFISTNETGAILAERFIAGPLAERGYQSGIGYLNLGYLPGGQMGIRAFAQNPSAAAPYAFAQNSNLLNISLTNAWALPPLEGVASLSQFAAIIMVTDNADSARTWIEQTTSARGTTPLVVVSSAQAAPMLQPYYESKQIAGLVSGLYGGAVYEENNAGRPGTARTYWDAYSIGMLLAMALILVGGLWNLALGLRDRAAAREAE